MSSKPITMLLAGFHGSCELVEAEKKVSIFLAGFPGATLLIYDKINPDDPGLEEDLQSRGIDKLPYLIVVHNSEPVFGYGGNFDPAELSSAYSHNFPDERSDFVQHPLCPDCIKYYNELRYNAESSCCLSFEPIATLVWGDEHPDGSLHSASHSPECKNWMVNLQIARNHVWENGEIAEVHRGFWAQSQKMLPSWPGFSRLQLNDEHRESYRACVEEKEQVFEMVASEYGAEINYYCTGTGFVVKGFSCRFENQQDLEID